jgi:GNAT superfamily N-acetyltransferase
MAGVGDFGFVAENVKQSPVGMAWLRCFTATDPGYGFLDAAYPELSIWVSPSQRGVGVGTLLLISLLEEARVRGLPGVSLSVEQGNRARALYERVGFAPAGSEFDPGTLMLQFDRNNA